MASTSKGHIKLGAPGALRDYVLTSPRGTQRVTANPFTPSVGTTGAFSDLEGWAEWVQDNWQAGVGTTKPTDGGFSYASVDSRVPNQLILPARIGFIDTDAMYNNMDGGYYRNSFYPSIASAYSTLTLTTTGTYQRIALLHEETGGSDFTAYTISIYGFGCDDFTVGVYSDNAGSPNTLITKENITSWTSTPYPTWYSITLTAGTVFPDSTPRWVIIEPETGESDLTLVVGVDDNTTVTMKYWDGDSWETQGDSYVPLFYSSLSMSGIHTKGYVVSDGSDLYFLGGTGSTSSIAKYNSSDGYMEWKDVNLGAFDITDTLIWGDYIYLGTGSSNNAYRYTLSTDTQAANADFYANKMVSWNGYFYRSVGHQLYYSTDASTWEGPFPVGSSDFPILNMAGMGNDVYVATAEGLYYLAPGDFVVGVVPWGSVDSTAAAAMVNYQGSICYTLNSRVYRLGSDGSVVDIWIRQDDGLVDNIIGDVISLTTTNNWLIALVKSSSTPFRYTLWAWQTEGWHFLSEIPAGTLAQEAYYDRANSRLIVSCIDTSSSVKSCASGLFSLSISDYAINPYNDDAYRYAPYGWMETAKFRGDIYKLDKDFESVFATGESLASGQTVKVYWKDEDSTSWELLGTVDEDGDELRWSDYSTRPVGKWIRLGFLFSSTDPSVTPKVEALVLKYQPMINDRWRWTLNIAVTDNQQMLDGTVNPYTGAQMITHLDSMIQRVLPLIYEDFWGIQYEVKVTGATQVVDAFEYLFSDESKQIDVVYQLTIEQVNDTVYG